MGFLCGIVGLPNVGKSTLFNALTAGHADCSNYPFCTIEPNVGVVPVPDERLGGLVQLYHPEKVVPSVLEFFDIAGLVRGASRGEGLGNQFLSHIREVDAIAHVVRCFEDAAIVHVDGTIDPKRDIEIVETELLLKDLESVERRLADVQRRAKAGEKNAKAEADFWICMRGHLAGGHLARALPSRNAEESAWRGGLHLLTVKPVMYVCNVSEGDVARGNAFVDQVRTIAGPFGAPVVTVSAAIEAEIAGLDPVEREEFSRGLGLKNSELDRIILAGYSLLDLVTFFTVGEKEVRAWTVKKGTPVVSAAGHIHSDFEHGFICAEVARCGDLLRAGSDHALRESGQLRIEGREYTVQDGDVILVKFRL
ncbi:MAG: redox-regulated ATPase YchF [Bacteroidota bacterium]